MKVEPHIIINIYVTHLTDTEKSPEKYFVLKRNILELQFAFQQLTL